VPANLTPSTSTEQRYKSAASPAEKLAALEEMFALIPKHKGTEKLQAEIKKKISQARKELQQKKGPKRLDPSNIPREGAGRLVLAGPPNGGKSALLKAATNAEPEVAPYAFTTHQPEQGLVEWEDVQHQLIDLPPEPPAHGAVGHEPGSRLTAPAGGDPESCIWRSWRSRQS
jgi:ribosome-interacting GTPase 1